MSARAKSPAGRDAVAPKARSGFRIHPEAKRVGGPEIRLRREKYSERDGSARASGGARGVADPGGDDPGAVHSGVLPGRQPGPGQPDLQPGEHTVLARAALR